MDRYTYHFPRMRYNTVILVASDQKGRTLYLEGEVRFRQYSGFYWRKFPVFFLHFVLFAHAL